MNHTQLYFAIGIPSFLVVLAWITTMMQSNRLSDKVDRISERLSDQMAKLAEQQHKDSLQLMSYMVPLRMAKLENSR